MRTYLTSLAVVLFATTAFADDKVISISAGGVDVLKLSVPKDVEVIKSKKGEQTTIQAKTWKVYLWPVAKAKTVKDALTFVNEVIKPEFTDFKSGETNEITVAGSKATHLTGKGAEADDGDPGSADVVVFEVDGHVFAACVHGEKDAAAKQRPDLMAVLKTAKAP